MLSNVYLTMIEDQYSSIEDVYKKYKTSSSQILQLWRELQSNSDREAQRPVGYNYAHLCQQLAFLVEEATSNVVSYGRRKRLFIDLKSNFQEEIDCQLRAGTVEAIDKEQADKGLAIIVGEEGKWYHLRNCCNNSE